VERATPCPRPHAEIGRVEKAHRIQTHHRRIDPAIHWDVWRAQGVGLWLLRGRVVLRVGGVKPLLSRRCGRRLRLSGGWRWNWCRRWLRPSRLLLIGIVRRPCRLLLVCSRRSRLCVHGWRRSSLSKSCRQSYCKQTGDQKKETDLQMHLNRPGGGHLLLV
jgi:hypothetical protein